MNRGQWGTLSLNKQNLYTQDRQQKYVTKYGDVQSTLIRCARISTAEPELDRTGFCLIRLTLRLQKTLAFTGFELRSGPLDSASPIR